MVQLKPALERDVDDLWIANIYQGRLWMPASPPGVRTEDGSPIILTNIQARLEFRDAVGGVLLASMATAGAGAADGTITVSAYGTDSARLQPRLTAAVTQTLTPSYNSVGAMKDAGWGDLKVWSSDYEGSEPFHIALFSLRVWPEFTA